MLMLILNDADSERRRARGTNVEDEMTKIPQIPMYIIYRESLPSQPSLNILRRHSDSAQEMIMFRYNLGTLPITASREMIGLLQFHR